MEEEITLKEINERYKQIALLDEQTRVLNEETRLIFESFSKNIGCIDKFLDKEWLKMDYVKDKDV